MEILRDYSQIMQKNKAIFGTDFKDVPILDPLSRNEIFKLVDGITIEDKEVETTKLAELIFQLRDYSSALENYIKMFLFTKYYDGIYYFLNKLFVAHVKGAIYTSKNFIYSLQERFFDRFVEVVKTSDINVFDYIEFLFKIVEDDKSVINNWKRPAIEYLQILFRESEQEILSFVKNNPDFQALYFDLMLSFNTQKGLNAIFNNPFDAVINDNVIEILMNKYFKETIAFFDKNYQNAGSNRFHFIKILSSFESKVEVKTRLEDLYEEEQDIIIKDFIKNKLGINDNVPNFTCSSMHFNSLAQKRVKHAQNAVMGISFDKLNVIFKDTKEPLNNTAKTFIINLFDESINLEKLFELKNICQNFDDGLYSFATVLFNKVSKFPDINRCRWAIRLMCVASYGALEQNLFNLCYSLFADGNKTKQAKYLLLCLIYSKKKSVVDLLQELTDENISEFVKDKDYYYQIYCKQNDLVLNDVFDQIVTDEVSEDALISSGKKLYNSFVENKRYTSIQFEELFVCKKLYNELAQGLVFGEYNNEKLCSIFMLKGKQRTYLFDTKPFIDNGAYIKLVHSLDLEDKYEDVKKLAKNKYCNQFSKSVFNVRKFDKTVVVSSMRGMLVNAKKFIKNLKDFGFVQNYSTNKQAIESMLYLSPQSNIIAEVEFEIPIKDENQNNSSLGNIRFYKMSEAVKHNNYYVLNKSNSLLVKDIPYRLFDFCMSSVSNALKY